MSTYVQVRNRIADDVRAATTAATSDIASQIAQCVLLAIQHYKNERLWFNETTTTLTATSSQSYVDAPSDILVIDNLYLTVSGRNIRLIPQDLDSIIAYRPSSNGRPRAYCYYQNRFELDRPSDSAYSMPIYYVKELAALSADADTNGWTTDGEDLIVYHAEKKLYANVIKDLVAAASAQAQERDALTALRARRNDRVMTGYTRPVYL